MNEYCVSVWPVRAARVYASSVAGIRLLIMYLNSNEAGLPSTEHF